VVIARAKPLVMRPLLLLCATMTDSSEMFAVPADGSSEVPASYKEAVKVIDFTGETFEGSNIGQIVSEFPPIYTPGPHRKADVRADKYVEPVVRHLSQVLKMPIAKSEEQIASTSKAIAHEIDAYLSQGQLYDPVDPRRRLLFFSDVWRAIGDMANAVTDVFTDGAEVVSKVAQDTYEGVAVFKEKAFDEVGCPFFATVGTSAFYVAYTYFKAEAAWGDPAPKKLSEDQMFYAYPLHGANAAKAEVIYQASFPGDTTSSDIGLPRPFWDNPAIAMPGKIFIRNKEILAEDKSEFASQASIIES
jgi:hypothetical protein